MLIYLEYFEGFVFLVGQNKHHESVILDSGQLRRHRSAFTIYTKQNKNIITRFRPVQNELHLNQLHE